MSICNEYLAHHGIKGQKWGVRRYQNDDGTLTPEGRERYLKEVDRAYNESKYMRKVFKDGADKAYAVLKNNKNGQDFAKSLREKGARDDEIYTAARKAYAGGKQAMDAASKSMKYEKEMRKFVNSKKDVKISEILAYSKRLGSDMGIKPGKASISLELSERNKLGNAVDRPILKNFGAGDGSLSLLDKWEADRYDRRMERQERRAKQRRRY